jgi:FkbH-like protein
MKLIEVLEKVKELESDSTSFTQNIKISILRNHTLDGITPYLKFYFYSSGINLDLSFGEYNNIVQESINSDSLAYQSNDIVVISLSLFEWSSKSGLFAINEIEVIEEIKLISDTLLSKTNSILIFNTFSEPFHNENGILSNEQSLSKKIRKINSFLEEIIEKNNGRAFLVNLDRIIRLIGQNEAMDYRFLYSARAPFKPELLNQYASEISKIGRALKGKNKKCLILDCDNTLWKGIIGEDGITGIKLDPNNYPGNIFYNFQQSVVQLVNRGVIVALCSKNNESDVFEVLEKHQYSFLKRHHLAAWRINWKNKVDNIRELSEQLNIGLDYFVFVDDSPLECNLVKEQLPEVVVIQVPEKIYELPEILIKDGLFDSLSVTDEDIRRTDLYRSESIREESKKYFTDISSYLESLNIELEVFRNDFTSVKRLAQLTQKTNQFNLTTLRCSEEQISDFISEPNNELFHFSVKDKFGDMGITGLIMANIEDNKMKIQNFLMSCRVLGRNIESAFIHFFISKLIEEKKLEIVTAEFLPTKKNIQVKEFWKNFGFDVLNSSELKVEYFLHCNKYIKSEIDYIKINYLETYEYKRAN